jgi:hypothetical protein
MASAPPVDQIAVTDAAWEAIQDGWDLQVHVAPDVVPRRVDDLDLAQEFARHKLKGFVLKSHYVPTFERAKAVTKAANNGVTAYGSITLNHSVGGLNPVALEIAGRSGAKIVWFPTVDAANETAGRTDGPSTKLPFWAQIQRDLSKEGISPPPITVLDRSGKISDATLSCLERIEKHNMILATGHLSQREIFELVRTAKDMGVKRVIVTHAEFPSQNFSPAQQVELAKLGAVIEHCFTTMWTRKASWEGYFESVRAVGPERIILSTDLGQSVNPPIALGFAMFAQKMLDNGFSKQDIRRMAVQNPAEIIA